MRRASLWTTCRGCLVAAAFAIAPVACSDAPSDPVGPGEPSDVSTAAAPVEGEFTLRVFANALGPGGFCSVEQFASGDDPPTYNLPVGVGGAVCLIVELTEPPDTGGTIVMSQCVSNGTGLRTSSTACTESGGGGHWSRLTSEQSTDGLWEPTVFAPDGSTTGIRLQYKGMGSGVKNETLPPFDLVR